MTEYIVKCGELVAVTGKTFQFPEYIDQTEEIVRCRDCKHLIAHGAGCAYWDYCDIESIDGFCAWGERRDA